MKKIILLSLLCVVGFMPVKLSAQVNVNVNIGSQPLWGPVGYEHADYYYLPDIESYYDVTQRQFVSLNNGTWVFTRALPSRYSSYNLYNGYKVVINSPKPYLYFKDDKVKYAKFKGYKSQPVISRSSDPKYFIVKGHPKNINKVKNVQLKTKKIKIQNHGNAYGKGHGKGKH
ncbi:hypothetical protein [Pedobacter punctiformis]|uniref:Uncharacterized protein n=1 Tax=Pedobacter punctiformis TaxID=3004097 RepID=A0ABT4LAR3_9SPHI|nr:hypothetical protein [Pedobacter sp. HCMS5-2]MCZ4244248.1 hypothetical protein [Pedobacter sp. HCMS5-2]